MDAPVLLVVDDEAGSLQALTQVLESRYGSSYEVIAYDCASDALARLEMLRGADAAVALVLADQWMPEMTGTQLLARG